MRLGRITPSLEQRRRAPSLRAYLRGALPRAPLGLDHTQGVDYRMYANDRVGDCTVAALAHYYSTVARLRGESLVFDDAEVTSYYYSLTGGADTGLIETDVLEAARQEGFPISGQHRLAAWVRIDAGDLDAIRSCADIFGAVYLGAGLATVDELAGWWDSTGSTDGDEARYSWGGHAAILAAYDQVGPTLITWGRRQRASWAWWRMRVDEAYALLDEERAAVAGVDWAGLLDHLAALSR